MHKTHQTQKLGLGQALPAQAWSLHYTSLDACTVPMGCTPPFSLSPVSEQLGNKNPLDGVRTGLGHGPAAGTPGRYRGAGRTRRFPAWRLQGTGREDSGCQSSRYRHTASHTLVAPGGEG